MTTKTPEQIADEQVGNIGENTMPKPLAMAVRAEVRAMIARVIEADRTQRPPIQVAVIEWPDDVAEPSVLLASDPNSLRVQVRAAIEAHFAATVPEHAPEPREWVEGEGRNEPDFVKWHGTLHECDGTPWVTFTEQEVSA